MCLCSRQRLCSQGGTSSEYVHAGVLSRKEPTIRVQLSPADGQTAGDFVFAVSLQIDMVVGSVPVYDFMGWPSRWVKQSSADAGVQDPVCGGLCCAGEVVVQRG